MRYRKTAIIVAVSIIIFPGTSICGETSLRCGNDIVSTGDSMYEVRNDCGDPAAERRVGEKTTYTILEDDNLKVKDVFYITEWVYERDSGVCILTFEGSRLVKKEFIR